MTARRHIAAGYAAWADERRLAEGEHDAAYVGVLSGVHVQIDTGVRDSGLYAVVVRMAIACGLEPLLLKRSDDVGAAREDRVVAAARELLRESSALRSVRVDEDAVELRLNAGSDGGAIEAAVRRIADAWRSPGRAQAPFR